VTASVRADRRAQNLTSTFDTLTERFRSAVGLLPLIKDLPLPSKRKIQRSTAAILRVVDAAIADRKAGKTRPALGESDLLDMMLSVRYEDGSSMPDKQVRDEAMTFVLAGHESTTRGGLQIILASDYLSDRGEEASDYFILFCCIAFFRSRSCLSRVCKVLHCKCGRQCLSCFFRKPLALRVRVSHSHPTYFVSTFSVPFLPPTHSLRLRSDEQSALVAVLRARATPGNMARVQARGR
jgi:hypothetical protein